MQAIRGGKALKSGTFAGVALAALLLAGCQTASTTKSVAEMLDAPAPAVGGPLVTAQPDPDKPKSKPAAAAADDDDPNRPLEKHEIAAQCWMKVDKARIGNIDQRAQAVDKCVAERMKTANVKR